MTAWLVDTFVYTGLLIALVLLVRKPVARHFGPQVAYALWALPLLRFAMPPLVLPAWMAPASGPAASVEPLALIVSDAPSPEAAAMTYAPEVAIGVLDVLLPVWLAGAALFLIWRTRSYLAMRRELLEEALPVGRAGNIRLVETPAVSSPVAFGIADRVIALPPAFMARPDRCARDLAIAHELAHHRGHDLLANIAAQPLLALHWFNPLAWAGWRAMRRDQEAACDARVVAGCGRLGRAAYAQVIAEFAAGDRRLSLAAPMACPMLGEKSIIHRLRILTRDEVAVEKRRKGLASVSIVALALPFTASISYAAPEVPLAHPAPVAPGSGAAPPAPQPPLAPLAPVPPEAYGLSDIPPPPEVPLVPDVDFFAHPEERAEREALRMEQRMERAEHIEERRQERIEERHEARFEAELEASLAEMEAELELLDDHLEDTIGRSVAEAGRAISRTGSPIAVAGRSSHGSRIDVRCEGDEPVIERDLGHGRKAIIICNPGVSEQAVRSLREARDSLAHEKSMPREHRERAVRQLDREIERLTSLQVSYRLEQRGVRVAAPPPVPRINVSHSVQVDLDSEDCVDGEIV